MARASRLGLRGGLSNRLRGTHTANAFGSASLGGLEIVGLRAHRNGALDRASVGRLTRGWPSRRLERLGRGLDLATAKLTNSLQLLAVGKVALDPFAYVSSAYLVGLRCTLLDPVITLESWVIDVWHEPLENAVRDFILVVSR